MQFPPLNAGGPTPDVPTSQFPPLEQADSFYDREDFGELDPEENKEEPLFYKKPAPITDIHAMDDTEWQLAKKKKKKKAEQPQPGICSIFSPQRYARTASSSSSSHQSYASKAASSPSHSSGARSESSVTPSPNKNKKDFRKAGSV